MHQGRPYGLHVIGGKLTDNDSAFIESAARKLTNLKELSGIDSLKSVYDLPDGGSFIVQDMGGNFRVIAHKVVIPNDDYDDYTTPLTVPMLFSGAVNGSALLKQKQGLPLRITQQTRSRLMGYTSELAPESMRLLRFACPYGINFQEFIPPKPINGAVYTQYIDQRPTWYSGAMAEVMQIVGGYGRQDFENLPDEYLERVKFSIPDKYQEAINLSLKDTNLPAYTGRCHKKGEYQCRYGYLDTDLVGFDRESQPWLVRINSTGVWAMPLPVIPATKTNAFHEYIKEVGDSEIQMILDRFGAMPSGETFPPQGSDFEAWRRAGAIIKVCSSQDFYSNLAYSSAMGWSMNDSGNEAVNTCYNIEDGTNYLYSMAYKLRLRLGAAKNNGLLSAADKLNTEPSIFLPRYLERLYKDIQKNTQANRAVRYKLARTSIIELNSRAAVGYSPAEVDYWNNLELQPIAIHDGNMQRISKGRVYQGKQVKVPEPMLGGCISLPTPKLPLGTKTSKSDTIVLAYYIGDTLKTVKYFNDEQAKPKDMETDFEEAMIVGKWRQKEWIGAARIDGSLYITDVDDRQLIAPAHKTTTIEGVDLGFTKPTYRNDAYFWRTGGFSRLRHYTTKKNTVTTYNPSLDIATTIPFYCRNAVIYANIKGFRLQSDDELFVLNAVNDPNYYLYWTFHEKFTYYGKLEKETGVPYPKDGFPVWAEIYRHSGAKTPYSEFADEGPWLPALPFDISGMMYQYSSSEWYLQNGPPPPAVKNYSISNETKATFNYKLLCNIVDGADLVKTIEHSDWYYAQSPNQNDDTFYRDACKVVFGDITYANISETNETGNRRQWGRSVLVNNQSAHHFIGVINE